MVYAPRAGTSRFISNQGMGGTGTDTGTVVPDVTEGGQRGGAERTLVRRESQLRQVADSITSLQRKISKVSAEDFDALLDPSSLVAGSLAVDDAKEREKVSEREQRRPDDVRRVHRDGTFLSFLFAPTFPLFGPRASSRGDRG